MYRRLRIDFFQISELTFFCLGKTPNMGHFEKKTPKKNRTVTIVFTSLQRIDPISFRFDSFSAKKGHRPLQIQVVLRSTTSHLHRTTGSFRKACEFSNSQVWGLLCPDSCFEIPKTYRKLLNPSISTSSNLNQKKWTSYIVMHSYSKKKILKKQTTKTHCSI